LPVPLARGEQQELFGARELDRLRNGEVEVTSQVRHRLGPDALHPLAVARVVGVELLRPQEGACLVDRGDVQSVPVDHRLAPERQPQRLEVAERQLFKTLEPLVTRRHRRPS
jgi:hypothetical protein